MFSTNAGYINSVLPLIIVRLRIVSRVSKEAEQIDYVKSEFIILRKQLEY